MGDSAQTEKNESEALSSSGKEPRVNPNPAQTTSSRQEVISYDRSAESLVALERDPHNIQSGLAQLAAMAPALRLLAGMLIATLVICALFFGRELLIPLALAMLLGFLLDPAVSRLKRWGLPRMAAALMVVVIVLAALGGLGMYLGTQVQQLSADLPTYQNTIRDKLRSLRKQANMPSAWDGALKTYNTVEKEIGEAETRGQRVQKVEIQSPDQKPTAQMMQWLVRIAEPVTTAGIVLLFVILILLDRDDLRDRMLRLMGGNLNLATDAMDEASSRIGKYLRMQFVVNVTYGIPMAAGLWLIGVPGAILWGVMAAIMRFVPYVGPLVSAIFPLALAFAVDPGWQMLLMTLGLIVVLEMVSNNIIEPWLYGSSTGLSTLSIIVAATFWTALWGPIGLILSTPLTVCLLVLGRYIPSLQFMEVLLGSTPVLDGAHRLYQRLLAGDVEDAIDMAQSTIEEQLTAKSTAQEKAVAVADFYAEVAIPSLLLATQQHLEAATAEHRLRLSNGMDALLDELQESYTPALQGQSGLASRPLKIYCAGARWEVDSLAAVMVAHVQQLRGHTASSAQWALAAEPQWQQAGKALTANDSAGAQFLHDADLLVLSIFSAQPQVLARQLLRRIHRVWPHLRVVLALWNAPQVAAESEFSKRIGADACVSSLGELQLWIDTFQLTETAAGSVAAPIAEGDAARVEALHASGVLNAQLMPVFREAAQQAANAFDCKWAQVSWVDTDRVHAMGSLLLTNPEHPEAAGMAREDAICSYVVHDRMAVVIPDIARDPRFESNAAFKDQHVRFYAGVPITDKKGLVLGSFSVMDDEPREMSEDDLELLTSMAKQLMLDVRKEQKQGERPVVKDEPEAAVDQASSESDQTMRTGSSPGSVPGNGGNEAGST